MASSKRSAAGCGTIRKKVVQSGGKEYTYWEARYSNGFDPGTGKQIQKSISGKTQKEVAQKMGKLQANQHESERENEPEKTKVKQRKN